jgi:hypothetical protein
VVDAEHTPLNMKTTKINQRELNENFIFAFGAYAFDRKVSMKSCSIAELNDLVNTSLGYGMICHWLSKMLGRMYHVPITTHGKKVCNILLLLPHVEYLNKNFNSF